jgi:hypothetical protein
VRTTASACQLGAGDKLPEWRGLTVVAAPRPVAAGLALVLRDDRRGLHMTVYVSPDIKVAVEIPDQG